MLSTEMQPALHPEQRLDRMERTLSRICAELDICFRAQQALLVALNAQDQARKLGEEFELLHQERDEERMRRSRADTIPPGAAEPELPTNPENPKPGSGKPPDG